MKTVEFSSDGYASIINAAKAAGYTMGPIRERRALQGSRSMLLRHDVDLSLECAVALAENEHALEVSSTYFILLHNDFYNPLSPSGRKHVRRLVELGHEVGLHWDSSQHAPDPALLKGTFTREVDLLSEIASQPVVSASQHIPIDSPLLDVKPYIDHECYDPEIQEHFTYVSDSAMRWRERTPLDLIDQGVGIQFLAHPIWWTIEGTDFRDKLAAVSTRSTTTLATHYTAFADYVQDCLNKRAELDADYARRRAQTAAT